jgi:cytochrome c oxidase subunit III
VTGPREVRVVALPTELSGTRSPMFWGIALLLTIEAVVFATLVSAYLYLRFHAPEWPPGGTPPPALLPSGLAILVLAASSGAVEAATRAVHRGRTSRASFAFVSASLLCWVFLLLLVMERAGAAERWTTDAYGSVVWVTLILYALHVLVLGAAGALMARLVNTGDVGVDNSRSADLLRFSWHCIAAAWLPIFGLIYLFPRMVAS